MKASFRFLKWQVYGDAKALFRLTLDISGRLPKEIRYDLGGQIIRASSSVIFNIAEGSGKRSDKELNRTYLKIEFASESRHARESGHPERLENTGFPPARE